VGRTYRLASDGDALEQRAWYAFLARDFPSYEEFWIRSVVPLTKRPEPGGFRPKAELDAMGKTDQDICLAQLNYTVLGHLDVAHGLLGRSPVGPIDFTHAMVRLSSAGDVAHEFLERLAHPATYDPWSEEDGAGARRAWRKSHRELEDIHNYRNRLLHGRLPMGLVDSATGAHWFPRLGHAIDLDWRGITEHFDPARARHDFDTAHNVLADSWSRVVRYIESNWQAAVAAATGGDSSRG
jgi:hypothetical protein